MPETSSLQRYRSRIEYLKQHLQLVDLALKNVEQLAKSKAAQHATFLAAIGHADADRPMLDQSVGQSNRLCSFSRSQNIKAALVGLYIDFTEYLRGILEDMYLHAPLKIVGKAQGELKFTDIVKLGNYEALGVRMVDEVFRHLEGLRSTPKLLDGIISHTSITLTDTKRNRALGYLELRHLIIHRAGVIDQKWHKAYKSVIPLAVGDKVPLKYATAEAAIASVSDLVSQIDQRLIGGGHVSTR